MWKAETSRAGSQPPLDACLHGDPSWSLLSSCSCPPRVCRSQPRCPSPCRCAGPSHHGCSGLSQSPEAQAAGRCWDRAAVGRKEGASHGNYLETRFLGILGLDLPAGHRALEFIARWYLVVKGLSPLLVPDDFVVVSSHRGVTTSPGSSEGGGRGARAEAQPRHLSSSPRHAWSGVRWPADGMLLAPRVHTGVCVDL